ncbi:MAG: response regulator [Chloroflexi bacterium]|nr:response regulator [Chloroflexota bacterium]
MTGPAVILAVEDDPGNVALLRAILEKAGHRLVAMGSLGEARAWLAGAAPDLVLLDRHLPDGDGLDLLAEIRRDERASVPVLMVSASVLPGDRDAALAAGCDAFIEKPVRVRTLLDAIARSLAA